VDESYHLREATFGIWPLFRDGFGCLGGAGLLRLTGLLEDDARPEGGVLVVGQVLAGDP
jgi:hypothetical protein